VRSVYAGGELADARTFSMNLAPYTIGLMRTSRVWRQVNNACTHPGSVPDPSRTCRMLVLHLPGAKRLGVSRSRGRP